MFRSTRLAIVIFVLTLKATTLCAQEMTLELDSANTKINFTLQATLHTVRGVFKLRSGTIHCNLSTGSASGLVVVDATSGDTGNKSRDHEMHQEILESQRYPEIIFIPTSFAGTVANGASEVKLNGVLRLHGVDHPMTLILPVQVNGNSITAKTHMVIPYVAWGLKNPSTLILRVSQTVEVDIASSGQLKQLAGKP
jgi:polyisoprenoid-binding protein YceI